MECACGCGQTVNPKNPKARFVAFHQLAETRSKRGPRTRQQPHPCECGCGEMAAPYSRFVGRHGNRGKKRGEGRYLDRNGYVLVRMPDHPQAQKGYVLEHRLVMEQTIGRPLRPDEMVHHMNHEKADNRPENLMLLDRRTHGAKHGRPVGRPVTDEHRARLSAAGKAAWAKRRE